MAKINRGKNSEKSVAEETSNVILDTDEVTEAPENIEEDTGVTFEGIEEDNDTPTPTPPKSVKIKMAKDHRCSIGGVFYNLEAGKTYVVPENVKRILGSVNLLLPL